MDLDASVPRPISRRVSRGSRVSGPPARHGEATRFEPVSRNESVHQRPGRVEAPSHRVVGAELVGVPAKLDLEIRMETQRRTEEVDDHGSLPAQVHARDREEEVGRDHQDGTLRRACDLDLRRGEDLHELGMGGMGTGAGSAPSSLDGRELRPCRPDLGLELGRHPVQ